uniref:diaminopimelate epimerase n=1 Tax=Armatimonas sp. TaxID=1872638 RepID=UPI003750FE50
RFGIGADGLLTYTLLNPSPQPPSLSQGRGRGKGRVDASSASSRVGSGQGEAGDLHFRIFNADGSEDTMCGNGLRCVVTLAVERGQIPVDGIVQTRSGPVPYKLTQGTVTLTLPPPQFWEQSVPGGTTVDTGSLHTVLWPTVLPSDTTFLQDSPALENAPLFPEKTSVLWTVATAPNQLQLRIWERGVGETLGCGTGACAAAAVAIQTGRATRFDPVQVTSCGGTLTVAWDGLPGASLQLTGAAEMVFSGTL